MKLRIGGENKRKKEKEGLEGTWNGKEWLGMERRGYKWKESARNEKVGCRNGTECS